MSKTKPGVAFGTDADTAVAVRPALTASDNATVNDTNYPPANATICAGWRSVRIHATSNGDATATLSVTPLYRVGARWIAGSTTALTDGASVVIDTMGRDVWFRATSVTLNTATSVTLWCGGWEPLGRAAVN